MGAVLVRHVDHHNNWQRISASGLGNYNESSDHPREQC